MASLVKAGMGVPIQEAELALLLSVPPLAIRELETDISYIYGVEYAPQLSANEQRYVRHMQEILPKKMDARMKAAASNVERQAHEGEVIGMSAHRHSPEHKKRIANRLARAAGHLEKIRRMVDEDADCAEILIQLAAVRSALTSASKEIINEHIDHCVYHAIQDGDQKALEEFRSAIDKFI